MVTSHRACSKIRGIPNPAIIFQTYKHHMAFLGIVVSKSFPFVPDIGLATSDGLGSQPGTYFATHPCVTSHLTTQCPILLHQPALRKLHVFDELDKRSLVIINLIGGLHSPVFVYFSVCNSEQSTDHPMWLC